MDGPFTRSISGDWGPRMSSNRLPTYGGQAVIEGVMMRGRQVAAIAVRAPDNQIIQHIQPLSKLYRSRLAKTPFLRGLLGLWDALVLGWQSLSFSASTAAGEEVKFEGPAVWLSLAISLTIGFGLFLWFPTAVAHWCETVWKLNAWVSNGLEGLVRLGALVVYMWGISFVPGIRRVWGYHGAEHKTINAFEAGAELTPESVARFPREHTRCGTAFLLTVVLLSIVLFALLGPLPWLPRLASRLLFVPVLASLAYEYLRFTARHISNPLVRALVLPNLALQRLTTREPDLPMIEVALAAFAAMREKEGLGGEAKPPVA
jgi:uncharacterized protein YqhQ